MNQADDTALYEAFLEGDNSAYDSLMIKYGDALTMYLKGFLESWEDAEDLMIEAFARIMVKKPKIESDHFKAYLYRIAHNLVSHFYSSRKKRKDFSLDSIDIEAECDTLGENPSDVSNPYESFWDDEKKRIIRTCLGRINEDMREALWLFYFDNLSYKDTAAVMNVNFKKIDNLLTRGRKCLKEELEKEGITDAY
ncbi:MAG: RNA polymerase sigma factor [Lachnospiraceae bacterium]|nr:RNA polymerase sigma factor [Lachnospiraceae bacterium]